MRIANRQLMYLPLVALVATTSSAAPVEGAASRPNVLFVAVDDMRDWVGCLDGYGGEIHTPSIDRLANRGTLFTNAHTASPVCCPSRAAVMSGRRPSSTGIYSNQHWWKPHRPNLVTLPTAFRNNGYETVGAGKLFHHTVGNNPPCQWDDYHRLVFHDDAWTRTSPRFRKLYPFTEPRETPDGFPYSGLSLYSPEVDWGVLPQQESAYDDVRTVDVAIEFLDRRHEKPFFLAVGTFRPHLPWYTPQRFVDLYPREEIQLPQVKPDDLNDVPKAGRELAERKRSDLEKVRDAGQWRRAVQMYLASISFADSQVGRLIDALDENELAENTIIMFWSDHGWHLGEKGHWHKRTLWEEATRVPLVVVAPHHGEAGQRCAQPVSLIDLYPTLADLCSLPAVADLDGESLAPLLDSPTSERAVPAIIEDEFKNCAVRTDRYRYIRYQDGSEELYDHQSDPNEWTNLAGRPEYDKIKQRLAKWATSDWAKPAPTKTAYRFDPESYTWVRKADGETIDGKD